MQNVCKNTARITHKYHKDSTMVYLKTQLTSCKLQLQKRSIDQPCLKEILLYHALPKLSRDRMSHPQIKYKFLS